MENLQFSEDNKAAGTNALFLKYAGFKMSGKYCFYMQGSKNMIYLSETSIKSGIKTGKIKTLEK